MTGDEHDEEDAEGVYVALDGEFVCTQVLRVHIPSPASPPSLSLKPATFAVSVSVSSTHNERLATHCVVCIVLISHKKQAISS
jgi:hypothetical protein